ncbi:MAG TPA: PQQ-dependent sugar dehydrogenase, partial [Gemmatimonadales bacterium]|nr:PQQ-dependent sugar dehydrogenase [Gemmatimonadales bacterium]
MSALRPERALLLLLLAAAAACGRSDRDTAAAQAAATGSGGEDDGVPCTPLETRPPNADGQRPEFEGQTRTCGVKSTTAFDVTVVAKELEHPWAVEPLPDGSLLVTEKPGRMRVVSARGELGKPVVGVPEVDARGQGGLLDVTLDPAFPANRRIYLSFAEPGEGGTNSTAVARATLSEDNSALSDVEVIFSQQPKLPSTMHYGSRLVFDRAGDLFVTLGERSEEQFRGQAQELNSHLGKVVRIHPDGDVPEDNPFVHTEGALPEIWSYGHRNIQAAALHPETGEIWEIEHG